MYIWAVLRRCGFTDEGCDPDNLFATIYEIYYEDLINTKVEVVPSYPWLARVAVMVNITPPLAHGKSLVNLEISILAARREYEGREYWEYWFALHPHGHDYEGLTNSGSQMRPGSDFADETIFLLNLVAYLERVLPLYPSPEDPTPLQQA